MTLARMSEILKSHGIKIKPGKPEKFNAALRAMIQCQNETFVEAIEGRKTEIDSLIARIEEQKELIDILHRNSKYKDFALEALIKANQQSITFINKEL